jgi:DNA-binding CsgD family transcriptional regulator
MATKRTPGSSSIVGVRMTAQDQPPSLVSCQRLGLPRGPRRGNERQCDRRPKGGGADLKRRATELQQLALRTATEPPPTPQAPLTPRQLEILRLVAQGLTNSAIAERLVVTESTVKWHVKQILAKTGSTNRAEAVARVLRTAH